MLIVRSKAGRMAVQEWSQTVELGRSRAIQAVIILPLPPEEHFFVSVAYPYIFGRSNKLDGSRIAVVVHLEYRLSCRVSKSSFARKDK